MLLRRALLPLAVVLALGLVTAELAQAAPVPVRAPAKAVSFGGVHVGFGVGVSAPIRPVHRRGHPGRRVHPHGRWVVHREEVWVPGELIGYDRHGHPIHTEGFWTIERRRVWVPVRRHVVRPARRGYVAVGMRFH